MTGFFMHPAAVEAGTAGDRLHLGAVDEAGSCADGVVVLDLTFERLDGTGRRSVNVAVLHPFALYLVALDHIDDAVRGVGLAGDEPLSPRFTQQPAQLWKAEMDESRRAMPGITAGPTKPVLGLEHHDADTGAGEFERSCHPGVTRANDADIGLNRLVQRIRQRRIAAVAYQSVASKGENSVHAAPSAQDRCGHRARRAARRR